MAPYRRGKSIGIYNSKIHIVIYDVLLPWKAIGVPKESIGIITLQHKLVPSMTLLLLRN
jgi:hypothetical protein